MVPAGGTSRTKRFHEDFFGRISEAVPDPMEYYAIRMTVADDSEGPAGGTGKRAPGPQDIINYIGVPPVEKYLEKIWGLGGTVVQLKTTVPGFGYLAICLDTGDNAFGIWKDNPEART
jgi:hypothetical protein